MSAIASTSEVAAPNGRRLTVYEAGDPDGAAVLFHHGTPASGLPYEPLVHLAEEQGIRLVSYDRAGYAESSRDRGRDVAAVAQDVAAITAALRIERFATWGWSGGGPHALACAALLPAQVAAACSLAGVAPSEAEDLDWLAGMGEGNVAEFGAALEGEATLRPLLEAEALAGRTSTEDLVAALRTILSALDVAALEAGIGAYLLSAFQRGLAGGVDGWLDDDLAFARPWGFEPAEIRSPVLVVQGREDLMVPSGHGEWLANRIPAAEAWFSEDEGHLTLMQSSSVRRLNEWLLERL